MTDQVFIRNFKLTDEIKQRLEHDLDASIEELRNRPLYATRRNS